jgi:hypothetical protein
MRKRLSVYIKPTRFNLTLTFEQYKFLLKRKEHAKKYSERLKYKDLVKEWGVKQYFMATAMSRGIKQYDYRIWKEEQNAKQNRNSVSGLHQGRSQKVKVIYVQPGSY